MPIKQTNQKCTQFRRYFTVDGFENPLEDNAELSGVQYKNSISIIIGLSAGTVFPDTVH